MAEKTLVELKRDGSNDGAADLLASGDAKSEKVQKSLEGRFAAQKGVRFLLTQRELESLRKRVEDAPDAQAAELEVARELADRLFFVSDFSRFESDPRPETAKPLLEAMSSNPDMAVALAGSFAKALNRAGFRLAAGKDGVAYVSGGDSGKASLMNEILKGYPALSDAFKSALVLGTSVVDDFAAARTDGNGNPKSKDALSTDAYADFLRARYGLKEKFDEGDVRKASAKMPAEDADFLLSYAASRGKKAAAYGSADAIVKNLESVRLAAGQARAIAEAISRDADAAKAVAALPAKPSAVPSPAAQAAAAHQVRELSSREKAANLIRDPFTGIMDVMAKAGPFGALAILGGLIYAAFNKDSRGPFWFSMLGIAVAKGLGWTDSLADAIAGKGGDGKVRDESQVSGPALSRLEAAKASLAANPVPGLDADKFSLTYREALSSADLRSFRVSAVSAALAKQGGLAELFSGVRQIAGVPGAQWYAANPDRARAFLAWACSQPASADATLGDVLSSAPASAPDVRRANAERARSAASAVFALPVGTEIGSTPVAFPGGEISFDSSSNTLVYAGERFVVDIPDQLKGVRFRMTVAEDAQKRRVLRLHPEGKISVGGLISMDIPKGAHHDLSEADLAAFLAGLANDRRHEVSVGVGPVQLPLTVAYAGAAAASAVAAGASAHSPSSAPSAPSAAPSGAPKRPEALAEARSVLAKAVEKYFAVAEEIDSSVGFIKYTADRVKADREKLSAARAGLDAALVAASMLPELADEAASARLRLAKYLADEGDVDNDKNKDYVGAIEQAATLLANSRTPLALPKPPSNSEAIAHLSKKLKSEMAEYLRRNPDNDLSGLISNPKFHEGFSEAYSEAYGKYEIDLERALKDAQEDVKTGRLKLDGPAKEALDLLVDVQGLGGWYDLKSRNVERATSVAGGVGSMAAGVAAAAGGTLLYTTIVGAAPGAGLQIVGGGLVVGGVTALGNAIVNDYSFATREFATDAAINAVLFGAGGALAKTVDASLRGVSFLSARSAALYGAEFAGNAAVAVAADGFRAWANGQNFQFSESFWHALPWALLPSAIRGGSGAFGTVRNGAEAAFANRMAVTMRRAEAFKALGNNAEAVAALRQLEQEVIENAAKLGTAETRAKISQGIGKDFGKRLDDDLAAATAGGADAAALNAMMAELSFVRNGAVTPEMEMVIGAFARAGRKMSAPEISQAARAYRSIYGKIARELPTKADEVLEIAACKVKRTAQGYEIEAPSFSGTGTVKYVASNADEAMGYVAAHAQPGDLLKYRVSRIGSGDKAMKMEQLEGFSFKHEGKTYRVKKAEADGAVKLEEVGKNAVLPVADDLAAGILKDAGYRRLYDALTARADDLAARLKDGKKLIDPSPELSKRLETLLGHKLVQWTLGDVAKILSKNKDGKSAFLTKDGWKEFSGMFEGGKFDFKTAAKSAGKPLALSLAASGLDAYFGEGEEFSSGATFRDFLVWRLSGPLGIAAYEAVDLLTD